MSRVPFTREELEKRLSKTWWWGGITIAATVVCIGIAIAGIIFGYWAYTGLNQFNQPRIVYFSQFITNTPYVYYIEASGAPVVLSLPGDLTPYIGNIYRIYSNTAQPHVVQFSGPTATFDAAATTATFGGNIRDGFEFEVTSAQIANVKNIKNVVFT